MSLGITYKKKHLSVIMDLKAYSAGSANDESHKHLWLVGASLFIPQLNTLLQHNGYMMTMHYPEEFSTCENATLGKILALNKSDKSDYHGYHVMYAHIFNLLGVTKALNLLEIGLGTNNPMLVSTMGPWGRPGASLYAFRDYLPNSHIYGADIDRAILFDSDRIKTAYVDQLDMGTLEALITCPGFPASYDLIIDDGLHSIGANFNTLLFALNHLNADGWIVVEDINNISNWFAIDYILGNNRNFQTYMVKSRHSHMYLVNKLCEPRA